MYQPGDDPLVDTILEWRRRYHALARKFHELARSQSNRALRRRLRACEAVLAKAYLNNGHIRWINPDDLRRALYDDLDDETEV